MDRTIYFGPPGTGKTTTLLARLEEHLKAGVPAERIAFLTFTRRARGEALQRVGDVLGIKARELPYFKTIHAMAYRELKLSDGDVLDRAALREFGNALGLDFGHKGLTETAAEGITSQSKGDQLLAIDNLSRLRSQSLHDVWRLSGSEHPWPEVAYFSESYSLFKRERAVLDFTDVLLEYCERGLTLDVDVVFVDEAQDLSLLQWRAVHRASAVASVQYVAGDDDQAIYRWAGADVSTLTDLEGARVVLDHSYRLPRRVHELSQKIARRIKGRVPKDFTARDEEGLIERVPAHTALPVEQLLIQGDDTTPPWLFLVRNRFQMPTIAEWLFENGVVYTQSGGVSSIVEKEARAIYTWERLRKGSAVPVPDARALYAFLLTRKQIRHGSKLLPTLPDDDELVSLDELRARHGLLVLDDAPWFDVLSALPLDRRTYYRKLLRSRGTLKLKPSVQLETIHGSKGAEADNVVLFTRCSKRTWESANTADSDARNDEHRVWYVGVTRAKKRLVLVENTGSFSYSLA